MFKTTNCMHKITLKNNNPTYCFPTDDTLPRILTNFPGDRALPNGPTYGTDLNIYKLTLYTPN